MRHSWASMGADQWDYDIMDIMKVNNEQSISGVHLDVSNREL